MTKRGQVKQPLHATYLEVDAKIDSYKALWKKRVVLGWYPAKMTSDAHLASFILENINWRTGELQSVAIFDAGGHSLRSLSALTGLPTATIQSILERWVNLKIIHRNRIGEGRRGAILINWDVLRTGVSLPAFDGHFHGAGQQVSDFEIAGAA